MLEAMPFVRRGSGCWALALLLAASCARDANDRAQGPDDPVRKAPPAKEPAALRLLVPRSTYERGEPVEILVALENRSDRVRALPRPTSVYLHVEVAGPGLKGWQRYETGTQRVGRVKLAPGGKTHHSFPLHISAKRWWLDREGEFRVRATYSEAPVLSKPPWKVAAGVRKFRIVAPRSKPQAEAARLVVDPVCVAYLLRRDQRTWVPAAPICERIMGLDAPTSLYLRIARAEQLARGDYRPGQQEFVSDPKAAETLYRVSLPRLKDPLLAWRATRVLRDALLKIRDEKAADRAVTAFHKRFPKLDSDLEAWVAQS